MSTVAIKFALVGIVNTLIGLMVIFALKALLSWNNAAANAGGYTVGLVISFFLNRSFTFGHVGPKLAAAMRFSAVFAVAYLVNLGTVLAAIDVVDMNPYAAQVVGVVVYSILFFLGGRHFAFAPQR